MEIKRSKEEVGAGNDYYVLVSRTSSRASLSILELHDHEV